MHLLNNRSSLQRAEIDSRLTALPELVFVLEYPAMKELDKADLEPHDGMLIVHPDSTAAFSSAEQERWYSVLRDAQRQCVEACKPFIVSPITSEMTFASIAKENGLNDSYNYIPSDDIVERVASLVGKNARDVSLLVGGLYAELCVQNWVANLVETIEPADESIDRNVWMQNNNWWNKPERIGAARIDYSTTDASFTDRFLRSTLRKTS